MMPWGSNEAKCRFTIKRDFGSADGASYSERCDLIQVGFSPHMFNMTLAVHKKYVFLLSRLWNDKVATVLQRLIGWFKPPLCGGRVTTVHIEVLVMEDNLHGISLFPSSDPPKPGPVFVDLTFTCRNRKVVSKVTSEFCKSAKECERLATTRMVPVKTLVAF